MNEWIVGCLVTFGVDSIQAQRCGGLLIGGTAGRGGTRGRPAPAGGSGRGIQALAGGIPV